MSRDRTRYTEAIVPPTPTPSENSGFSPGENGEWKELSNGIAWSGKLIWNQLSFGPSHNNHMSLRELFPSLERNWGFGETELTYPNHTRPQWHSRPWTRNPWSRKWSLTSYLGPFLTIVQKEPDWAFDSAYNYHFLATLSSFNSLPQEFTMQPIETLKTHNIKAQPP